MDTNLLKMISNPYLLKKCEDKLEMMRLNEINETNKLLDTYLARKYPNLYIPTDFNLEIKRNIDDTITRYISKKLVNEIIDNVLNKFDN